MINFVAITVTESAAGGLLCSCVAHSGVRFGAHASPGRRVRAASTAALVVSWSRGRTVNAAIVRAAGPAGVLRAASGHDHVEHPRVQRRTPSHAGKSARSM